MNWLCGTKYFLDSPAGITNYVHIKPESQDKDGVTCLHLVGEGNIEMYQFLRHYAYSNAIPRDKSGRSPLHYACLSNHSSMANYLITSCHYKPDDPDYNGYTSVHAACEAGNYELVLHLLTERGCNAKAETKDGKTLLYYAIKSSNLELVRFLIQVMELKPQQNDTEAAQANNAIYKFLQESTKTKITTHVVEEGEGGDIFSYFEKKRPSIINPPSTIDPPTQESS